MIANDGGNLKDRYLQWGEAELVAAILTCAHDNGWLAAHFRPAWTGKGWRTAVQGDGAGFFDLVLCRHDASGNAVTILAEVKSAKGKLTPEQEAWRDAATSTGMAEIRGYGARVRLWRPGDWLTVQEELR